MSPQVLVPANNTRMRNYRNTMAYPLSLRQYTVCVALTPPPPPFPSSILAVLGIPPPQSLVSVPVVTALDGAAFSSPALPTQVTCGGTTPWPSSSLPTTGNPWAHVATSTPVQPGLTLSPAAQSFPQKLVDKARAGHFVEMKELLADNVSLLSQLEAVQGPAAISMLGPT